MKDKLYLPTMDRGTSYTLTPAYIMGPDHTAEVLNALKGKEICQYGDCTPRKPGLTAWDRMETNGKFGAMGM